MCARLCAHDVEKETAIEHESNTQILLLTRTERCKVLRTAAVRSPQVASWKGFFCI
jgi:hypothetical protein